MAWQTRKLLFVIPAIALVFGMTVIGCGNGSTDVSSGGSSDSSVTYTKTDAENTYELVITKNAAKAAYSPQVGDTYVLTINVTQTSKGTVTGISSGFLILKPTGTSTTFTVAISGESITTIIGTIILTDGTTFPPDTLTPGGVGGGNKTGTFTSIAEMDTWLSAQSYPNTAHTVVLNVNSLGGNSNQNGSVGNVLKKHNLYVYLDLSGSTIDSIGVDAFSNCNILTGITIPDCVTSIGEKAFLNTNLASVTIPDSVTSIGDRAFFRCNILTAINVDTSNPNFSSDQGVLYDKAKTTLLKYPEGKAGTFNIPSSVISIGGEAFSLCKSLTGIIIPNGVNSIGDGAFQGCSSLTTSVTIPNTVKSIGECAFMNCNSLTSITIGSGVTTIGQNAFTECYSLTSVIFQGTISSLAYYNNYFDGDLITKYLANGAGTYTRVSGAETWTKQ